MGFEIGSKVVCIKSHSKKATVEGKVYVLRAIRDECCTAIDVGITSSAIMRECQCGIIHNSDGTWWQNIQRFVPLDDWQAAEEAKESLLEELTVKI